MAQKILYTAQELLDTQINPGCVIVDCRFVLDNPDAGYEAYLDSHIPGAVYAHLDNDLAGPVTRISGRHPLPDADQFASFLARSGWAPGKLLLAYDDAGGAIAARLWWLMKYFGHDCSALLDGGISSWRAAGFDLESGESSDKGFPVAAYKVHNEFTISVTEIEEALSSDSMVLVDARSPERFSGEFEPIDSVAGRIPGSVNHPYNKNFSSNDTFRSQAILRDGLLKLLGSHPAEHLVHLCGSGVTACHNIFAAELAGLTGSRLYVGSWSEWIRDPSRPVALG